MASSALSENPSKVDYPFTTDGCSSPIRWLCKQLSNFDFVVACYEHDWEYWQGGTKRERLRSDNKFQRRIVAVSNLRFKHQVAAFYRRCIRLFGWLPFSDRWSWGYGWHQARRGPNTRFPDYETPYTTANQRYKLEQALRGA